MNRTVPTILALLVVSLFSRNLSALPDTGQSACYDNWQEIRCPTPGEPYYGQDAHYQGTQPAYQDNGDGTISDLTTGLMWSKGVDPHKVTPAYAHTIAKTMTLGGHTDWRVPTIKELYSLIDFRGYTGFSGRRNSGEVPGNAVPYINTDLFDFRFGNTQARERYIDAQWVTSTHYVSLTMGHMVTMFGVNFADGRIKGYGYRPVNQHRTLKRFYARYVRGNPDYGKNAFQDGGNGTVIDRNSGLIWMQGDSGHAMSWKDALAHAENATFAGHNDWRLPNAKELHSIVDYSRSPDTTDSAAIDPIFTTSSITNEAGSKDYPYFWTSTTHLDGPRPGSMAAYVSFGRAMGQMRGRTMDVHGAGAQRSDPKTGRPGLGHGPQGDAIRIKNYVRLVRGGEVTRTPASPAPRDSYPNRIRVLKNSADGSSNSNRFTNHQGAGNESSSKMQGGWGSGDFSSHFIKRLDRDGDGKVSRQEFDGPPDRFDVHDTDKDGYLSNRETPRPPRH
ncbi:MAG: DUF1566 domain-containing protein [Magnetococcales bacterium]|nr:DUF1566 domain-containing protein [Magnetococcales bacterium]